MGQHKFKKAIVGRRKKLVIGMPVYWTIPYQVLSPLLDLVGRASRLVDVDIVVISQPYIDFSRNEVMKRAAEKQADWVLFIDQDVCYPADMFERLAMHDVPVVSALYFQKTEPHVPLIYDFASPDDWMMQSRLDYAEGLVRCGSVGMGATLIKMEAFDAVLKLQIEKLKWDNPQPFRQNAPIGEDTWFCKLCQWADVPVYCDTTIKLDHIGLIPVSEVNHKIAIRYGSLEKAYERLCETDGIGQMRLADDKEKVA